ncbi:MAG: CcdB family protein [Pseudomonadota bacterium]
MARFDVYAYASRAAPLVIDVQANLLADLSTRVVVPLAPKTQASAEALPRLKPEIVVDATPYILMTTDIAALPTDRLGPRIGNLETAYRDTITAALDFLFQGF